MLHFLGSGLALDVEEVLEWDEGPILFTGRDFEGQCWLVAEVGRRGTRAAWLCAPQSPRAIQCVMSGEAEVRDAIRHSANGTAEVITLDAARLVEDQTLLCGDVPEEYLPAPGWRVDCATSRTQDIGQAQADS
jgi:hypothetical protein